MTIRNKLNLKKNKVFHNSIALILMQLVSYLSPILVLPYLARVMDIAKYGELMMLFSVLAVFQVVTDFGFNLSATYYISKKSRNKSKINKCIGGVFTIKFIISLALSILVLIIGMNFFSEYGGYTLVLVICIIFSQAFQPVWFYQGIEKMRKITAYTIASKLSYLFLVYAFSASGDINNILLCFLFSQLVATLFSILFIYRLGYSIKKPSFRLVVYLFKESFYFFISRASVVLYTSANTLVIGSFAGAYQAAIYSASEKLYNAGVSLLSPVSQAFYPHLVKNKDGDNYRKFVLYSSLILALGCFVVSVYSQEIIELFYGDKFSSSGGILKIFLIIIVITYVSMNFGYPMYATIGKVQFVNMTVILGAVVQFCGLYVLYSKGLITAYNLSLTILITESSVLLFRVILFYSLMRRVHVRKTI